MEALGLKPVSPIHIFCEESALFLNFLSSHFRLSYSSTTAILAMAGTSPETVNSDYQYTPLSGPRQIRVLRLKRSKSQQSPLEGELFEVTVDKPWPFYEAVSYTWLVSIASFVLLSINYAS
jgi:hypothetical protein